MSRLGTGQTDMDKATEEHLAIGKRLEWHHPASQESVFTVMSADADAEDGRSEWLWIRLANGDLIFGCFPQGDTYFAVEIDAEDR